MDELKPHMQIGLLIKSKPFIQLHTFGWIVFAELLITLLEFPRFLLYDIF